MRHAWLAVLVCGAARGGEAGDFWARTAEPGAVEFGAALAAGDDLLKQGAVGGGGSGLALSEAEAAFRRAAELRPARPEGWHGLGRVLVLSDGRAREGVAALERARGLGGPSYDAEGDIPFALGVAYTKLDEYEAAVREYDRCLATAADEATRARATTNAAEALMALGRLAEAIPRYRRAAETAPPTPPLDQDRQGAWWGLAVALDRDEQIARAEETARQALQLDPQIRYFDNGNVFFVPEGEVHYYYALAHEAAGQHEAAIRRWRQFLGALPDSPWAYRARQRLADLERSVAPPRATGAKARPRAPRPR